MKKILFSTFFAFFSIFVLIMSPIPLSSQYINAWADTSNSMDYSNFTVKFKPEAMPLAYAEEFDVPIVNDEIPGTELWEISDPDKYASYAHILLENLNPTLRINYWM